MNVGSNLITLNDGIINSATTQEYHSNILLGVDNTLTAGLGTPASDAITFDGTVSGGGTKSLTIGRVNSVNPDGECHLQRGRGHAGFAASST